MGSNKASQWLQEECRQGDQFQGSYRTHNSTYKLLLTLQTHKGGWGWRVGGYVIKQKKPLNILEWKKRHKKYFKYMKEYYQGTERCRVDRTDTKGDLKKESGGDKMEGGQIRGSFTNQH